MIKFNFKSGPFGDCTTNYDVETDAANVAQFIEEAVKENPDEWGEFCIRADNVSDRDVCVCTYNKGKFERKASNYDSYGAAKIKSVFANGGWSKMSYDIKVEEFDALPKQDKEEFQFVYWGKVLK